jgi:murein DD-endopeptidase MepM/ murein hydrolase activator NlpD
MRPIRWSRVTNPFAAPGGYASRSDAHGPAGHHTGIDFGKHLTPLVEIEGLPVRSCTPGTVVISEYNSTMGNWVGVYYANADVTLTYWHLDSRNGRYVGERVNRGDVIGFVGSTGNSTAPHLHVQANYGRGFDYHGHIDPSRWVMRMGWWRRYVGPRGRYGAA